GVVRASCGGGGARPVPGRVRRASREPSGGLRRSRGRGPLVPRLAALLQHRRRNRGPGTDPARPEGPGRRDRGPLSAGEGALNMAGGKKKGAGGRVRGGGMGAVG